MNITDIATEVTISAISSAAGGSILVYTAKHDPLNLNNSESSAIIGFVAGSATATLTDILLHSLKNRIVTKMYINKINKITKESKKKSVKLNKFK